MNIQGNIYKYLTDTLGFEVQDCGDMKIAIKPFPSLVGNLFEGRVCLIDGYEYVIIKPFYSEQTQQLSILINRVKMVEGNLNRVCILLLDSMDGVQRRQFIKHKINFLIPDRQLYLPSMGTYLTEKRLNSYKKVKSLTPAAQMLILYYLQKESIDAMGFKDIADRLNYPPKTISIVASELSQAGICDIISLQGRIKGMKFKYSGKELWDQMQPLMSSPVQKFGYLSEDAFSANDIIHSYDDALSHYTDMGNMEQHCYAIGQRTEDGKRLYNMISATNIPGSVRVEFWKYNPAVLSQNGYIDQLSMILLYKDDIDERIQGQLQRLVDRLF